MAKHRFLTALTEDGAPVGAQCARCQVIVLFVDGVIPEDIRNQECVREDVNQAAARVIREATEKY